MPLIDFSGLAPVSTARETRRRSIVAYRMREINFLTQQKRINRLKFWVVCLFCRQVLPCYTYFPEPYLTRCALRGLSNARCNSSPLFFDLASCRLHFCRPLHYSIE